MKQNNEKIQLSPFVYWAQTENLITLKIDLKNVKSPNIKFGEKSIDFDACGLGARGENDYKFSLQFYSSINENGSTYKIHDSYVDFNIKKCETLWWPRLIAQPQKPHWLKIDFDRWRSEDDIDENPLSRDVMEDYPGMYEKLQKEEWGYAKEKGRKVYMIFYNLAQFIGFLYIFTVMSILIYRDGRSAVPYAFETVGNAMKFCQILQFLEVLHPIFGYTKGGPLIPFLQVAGRNFVLFIMIDQEERMHTKPVVCYLFLIWTTIEIIRYPYYLSCLFNNNIRILTWLRYTIWIPLYPLGILCESVILLRSIPYLEETKRYSIDMPNNWNFTFNLVLFVKIYLLILVLPGAYILMAHMAKARAKKLGKGRANFIEKML